MVLWVLLFFSVDVGVDVAVAVSVDVAVDVAFSVAFAVETVGNALARRSIVKTNVGRHTEIETGAIKAFHVGWIESLINAVVTGETNMEIQDRASRTIVTGNHIDFHDA